jgi:hypothetical protein
VTSIVEAMANTLAAGAVLSVLALWAGMWRALAEMQARRGTKGRAQR